MPGVTGIDKLNKLGTEKKIFFFTNINWTQNEAFIAFTFILNFQKKNIKKE